jgi:hypothetical protein
MQSRITILAIVVLTGALCLDFVKGYRVENYPIIQTAFVSDSWKLRVLEPGAVCYSGEELREMINDPTVLEKANLRGLDTDTNLITIVTPGYSVYCVVSRNFIGSHGVIYMRKHANGTEFTVIKGRHRTFEFVDMDAAPGLRE